MLFRGFLNTFDENSNMNWPKVNCMGGEIETLRWNQNMISEQDLEKTAECSVLVFSFPLYVDCLPSYRLRCLHGNSGIAICERKNMDNGFC